MSYFATICRDRNAELPVSRLPPELLCAIFRILHDIEPPFYPNSSDYPALLDQKLPARLGWIKVTHVMYTWRDTAFKDSSLWDIITTSFRIEGVEEMLHRRRLNGPLHVDISPYIRAGHTHNIGSSVMLKTGMQWIVSLQIVGSSLPLLDREISMEHLCSLRVHLSSEGPTTLPRTLPRIQAPNIRELYLHNVTALRRTGLQNCPLNIAPLSNLTHLTLSQASAVPVGWPPLHILQILSQTPRLVLFKLLGYTLVVSSNDLEMSTDAFASLHLDELAHLELCITIAGAAYLLWRIRAGPVARMLLDLDMSAWSGSASRHDSVRFLRERLHSDTHFVRSLYSFRLQYHGNYSIVDAWKNTTPQCLLTEFELGSDDVNSERSPPDFQLRFHGRPSSITLGVLEFMDMFSIIPLDEAHNVSLQETKAIHRLPIQSLLPAYKCLTICRNLKWLRLDAHLAKHFLKEDHACGQSGDEPRVRLDTLAVFGIDWADPAEDWPSRIREILKSRKYQDNRLANVVVEASESIALLRAAIGDEVLRVLAFKDEEAEDKFLTTL